MYRSSPEIDHFKSLQVVEVKIPRAFKIELAVMVDENDAQQAFLDAIKPLEAAAASGAGKIAPQTPSPRKRFTRKNHQPRSTYQMFSSSLDQEAHPAAELEHAAELQRLAEARTESPSDEAVVAGRPKRQCRPKRFFGDQEAWVASGRALQRREGEGPEMQAASVSDAEGPGGHCQAANEPAQESLTEGEAAEREEALAGELQGGAQPYPWWDIVWDAAEAEEEEKKGKKANRKRKASKLAAGTKSVKGLLDAQGLIPQKQTDPDFAGHCPHCKETADVWRHAVKAPYAGMLVCSRCGIWDWRHPDKSLLEKPIYKAGARSISPEPQDVHGDVDAAFLEPDHMAAMPDLAHAAQVAPAAASDSIGPDQTAHMVQVAHMVQEAHMAQLSHSNTLAASNSSLLQPPAQPSVTVLPAPPAADPPAEQQQVQSAEVGSAWLGQGVVCEEEQHAAAGAPDKLQSDEMQAALQRAVDSSSASAARQLAATSPVGASAFAAGQVTEPKALQGAKVDTAVLAQGKRGGDPQAMLTAASKEDKRTAHSSSLSAGVAEWVAANEVVAGGAAQGMAANAADTVPAEQQAADAEVRSGLPMAAGHGADSAAIGAQHAGMQAESIASLNAVPRGTQRAKRAAEEEGGEGFKRSKGSNGNKVLPESNNSIGDAVQMDVHTNSDVSMRRIVRRRGVR